MATRRSSVVFLGDDAQLNSTLARIDGRLKALTATADEQNAKVAASSEAAGVKIGRAYDEGTTKAAGALSKLSALGGSLGLPLTGSLDAVGKKLDETASKTGKLHSTLAELGKVTLIGGTAGFAVAAAESTKMAESFQTATASIAANADITQKAADKIGNAFLGTAGHSIFSAQEMAAAFAAVAGQLKITEGHALNAADATKVMAAASDLAEGTHEALGTTTAALSTVMQAYHLSVGQAASASDTLFNVSRAMNVPLEAVATAVNKLHGRLGELAPTLTDTSALMIELGQHGITGTRGIQVVNTAFQTLVGGSKNTTAVLKDLGVHVFDQNGKFIGLQGVIAQLQPKLSDLTQKQQLFAEKTLFGSGAAQVMGQVVQAGVGKFQQATTAAQKMGTAHAAAGDQAKTLHNQIETLKATVDDLATKFGMFLIPKLEATGQAVQSVIAWFGRHQAAAKALAGVIGTVLGGAITVFAYTKAASFVGATKSMIGGLGRFSEAIISTASTVASKFGLMGASATTTEGVVGGAEDGMVATTRTAAGAIDVAIGATGVGAVMIALGFAATDMATHWSNVMNNMKDAVDAMVGAADKQLNLLIGDLNAAISVFNSTIGQLTGSIGAVGNVGVGGPFGSGNAVDNAIAAGRHGSDPALTMVNGHPADTATSSPTSGFGGAQSVNANPSQQGGAVPVPTSGSNAQRIAGALAAQGFSKVAIAGILGNLAQETGGGSLNAITPNATGPNGLGIEQATGSRRTGLEQYAQARNESPTSLAAQVGFLVQELRTDYKGVFQKIQNAPNAAAAAKIFDASPAAGGFEGGTDPGGIREKAAQQAMAMLTGSGGGSGSSNAALQKLMNGIANGTSTTAAKQPKALGIPTAVENMLHLAEQLEGAPYNNKAGHSAAFDETVAQIKKFGTDCSGLVSVLLKEGVTGIKAAQTTQGLPTNAGLSKGTGRYVTVYDRHTGSVANEHTIIDILGHYFESGGNKKYNPSGGVSQLTAKQAAGELSSGGFEAFHPTNLNSPVRGGSTANVPGNNIPNLIAQLEAAFTAALTKAADAMAQRFNSLVQSGTIKGLSAALGENSSHRVTIPGVTRPEWGRQVSSNWGTTTGSVNSLLHSRFENLGLSTNMGQIGSASGQIIAGGAAGSQQDKAFQSTVAGLIANGQKALAEKLVEAHKQAMQALGQEMYAQQALKDAESLQLEATHLKDQTSMQANYDAAMLDVVKAQYQLANDKADAEVTAIRDMTQTVTDQFSGMVQAVEDHTQQMADAASAVVTGINDNTQTQVDILGEKGLFGLNLIAQKLQVQLDQQKTSDDQAIAVAQQNLDAVTSQWHAAVQTAQLNVDQVTAQQDLLAAAAQQASDTVAIKQEARIASAQAKMDAVTMHEDISIVGPAQTAVDMNANAPKAQQDVFNNILKKATGQAGVAEGGAAKTFQGVQDSANSIMTTAAQTAQTAQNTAQSSIAAAGQTLAIVTGEANAAIANATGTLTGAQNAGALAEAPLQSGVSIEQATSSTQFSGSGAVINIYGVPTEDAGAIGNAASWALRTAAV